MKKIHLSIASVAIISFFADAQVIRLYKGDSLVTTYTHSQADRVVFDEDPTIEHNGHEYVDLGLKDKQGRTIYWATCNIGAENPEDAGLYFAWGETTGYGSDTSDGHSFYWTNYKWCNGSSTTMTKYCTDSDYGTVDNKIVLEPDDDAATQNWGGNWRMPTYEEQLLLSNKCTWTWDSAKNGYTVTGRNGNSIFLPAAGDRIGSNLYNVGLKGFYWLSSLGIYYSDGAYSLSFDSSGHHANGYSRYSGFSVRAVCVFDAENVVE